MKRENKIIIMSVAAGLLVWILYTVLDTLIFYEGSFFGLLITEAPEHEIYIRSVILLVFVAFGITVSRYFVKARLAEEKLSESEERYRLHFENVKDVVYSIDPDIRITSISPSVEAQLGCRPDEIIGRKMDELNFLPPEYLEKALANSRRILRGEQIEPAEYELVSRDGTRIFAEISAAPLFKDGRVVGGIGVGRNITDRKKAEEALRESEARYRTLVEHAPDAVVVLDAGTGRFVDFNQKALDLFGLKADELLSVGPAEVSLPVQPDGQPSAEKIKKATAKAVEEGTLTFEWTHVNSSGQEIPCEIYLVRFYSTGEPRLLGSIRDITERKQAEEEREKLEVRLRHAEKMEAIGTLAGGIAHDFNNLLMVIQGNISLLLNTVDASHPHYERLSNIARQVSSGAKLTDQLLGFAREGRCEVVPVVLNRTVEEVAAAFGRTRREITIHKDLADDLAPAVADQNQIEQVLLNLFLNAAEAVANGGDIFVKTMNVTHEGMSGETYNSKPGNYVLLTVTDTGSGMDAETLKRIFEPFFTTKELGRGAGLGLASTYGIVKGHGGYIDAQSEKGRGTTFKIYLPASDREVPKTHKTDKQILKGSGTMLIVDDEQTVLTVGGKMLEALGYNVFQAGGGREAINIYEANKGKIDLVILDLIMPDMPGGEVYEALKSIDPGVKTLLSSGYSVDGRAREILDRGCNGFIQKPFNMSQLSEEIQKILNGYPVG